LRSALCYQHTIGDSGENQTIHRRPQCQKREIKIDQDLVKIFLLYLDPVEG